MIGNVNNEKMDLLSGQAEGIFPTIHQQLALNSRVTQSNRIEQDCALQKSVKADSFFARVAPQNRVAGDVYTLRMASFFSTNFKILSASGKHIRAERLSTDILQRAGSLPRESEDREALSALRLVPVTRTSHRCRSATCQGAREEERAAVLGGVDFIYSQKSGVEEELFKGAVLGVEADIASGAFQTTEFRSFADLANSEWQPPARYLDKVALHLVKNMLSEQFHGTRVPLILGIWGGKGCGKTFNLELCCRELGVTPVVMSAGELENPTAGEPAKIIRERYRAASRLVSQEGRLSCLIINDLDAGVGRYDNTDLTVNTQSVEATLMALCDAPTTVSVGQAYAAAHTKVRVPIIVTGNDFSRVYAPLVRDGRMDKFYFNPTRPEKLAILSTLFDFPAPQLEALLDTFPGQSMDFYGALRARLYDRAVQVAPALETHVISTTVRQVEVEGRIAWDNGGQRLGTGGGMGAGDQWRGQRWGFWGTMEGAAMGLGHWRGQLGYDIRGAARIGNSRQALMGLGTMEGAVQQGGLGQWRGSEGWGGAVREIGAGRGSEGDWGGGRQWHEEWIRTAGLENLQVLLRDSLGAPFDDKPALPLAMDCTFEGALAAGDALVHEQDHVMGSKLSREYYRMDEEPRAPEPPEPLSPRWAAPQAAEKSELLLETERQARELLRKSDEVAAQKRAEERAAQEAARALEPVVPEAPSVAWSVADPEEAKRLLDEESYAMVDVRSLRDHRKDSVTLYKALSIPAVEVSGSLLDPTIESKADFVVSFRTAFPSLGDKVVLYGGDKDEGCRAMEQLIEEGFTHVVEVEGGFSGWDCVWSPSGAKRDYGPKWKLTDPDGSLAWAASN
ncbi:hypothetical protein CYMTET_55056 [Cymbomonas tetramitiformis]|uniref:Ribulose bisphosphate carboxylase/oxygenase activase, chloroplastic n=1 Tax=Cymbomonas tetramitiformis TaxID=36881 RepID=A0AAE0ENZ1_9CHLO|nr:hypothetical protein CYMTET_55056 [Cymbomonas tetramitiformis]